MLQLVFLDGLHTNPDARQQQGNKHLAAHQYKEAVDCYNMALLTLLPQQQQQHQQQQQQQQQRKQSVPASEQAELCELLLSVLLNLSAAHLQLQQPLPALLYAAAATALSCHSSSKAYYRAAVALDKILAVGAISSSTSDSGGGGSVRSQSTLETRLIAAAATELMQGSVRLMCNVTAAATSQMLAALTNVAAAKSRQSGSSSSSSSSKRRSADQHGRSSSSRPGDTGSDGEWQVVCRLLSNSTAELAGCFAATSSSSSSSSNGGSGNDQFAAVLSVAGEAKELGNTAFKHGIFTSALQHYQAALAALKPHLSPAPAILSCRAKAWLGQPSKHSQQQAFLDALASGLLDAGRPAEAFHIAAVALLQLDETSGALAVCELGLVLLPDCGELQLLLKRIQTAAAAAAAAAAAETDLPAASAAGPSGTTASSGPVPGSSGSGSSKGKGAKGKQRTSSSSSSSRLAGMTEREMTELMHRKSVGVEQLAMFNQFVQLAAVMGRGGSSRAGQRGRGAGRGRRQGTSVDRRIAEMVNLDDRVPQIHAEFAKAGRCASTQGLQASLQSFLASFRCFLS
jgi:tetratricopeptide (TPR) repeat protein